MNYNSYHTNIKIAAANNLLPEQILNQIPKSTFQRFKNTDYSTLIYDNEQSDFMETIKLAKELSEHKQSLKLFKAALYLRDKKIEVLQKSKAVKNVIRQVIVTAIN
jgi:hypothetical protein